MQRRKFFGVAAMCALAAVALPRQAFAATRVDVYKGPECDCCGEWMVYMRKYRSPGMEHPFIKPQAYNVVLIRADGSTRIWRSYTGS